MMAMQVMGVILAEPDDQWEDFRGDDGGYVWGHDRDDHDDGGGYGRIRYDDQVHGRDDPEDREYGTSDDDDDGYGRGGFDWY